MTKNRLAALAAVAAVVLTAAGCSAKATDGASDAASKGGFKTGPGITDSTITLGVNTDLSGPAAALGKPILQASQLYYDQVNATGGVCGRKIELNIQDNGYDVQKAVAGYTAAEPQIAAMVDLAGSPQTNALLDKIEQDGLPTLPVGPASALLGHPHLQVVGATYDIATVNGLDYLVKSAGLKSGDKVGVVYDQGEYGADVDAAAKFVAQHYGIQLVEQQVTAAASDMTPQVTALKAAGVKAVVFGGVPGQTASLVGVAAATGLRVPVLGTNSAFAVQLLATPVASALEKMLYVSSSLPPLTSTAPAVQKLVSAYQAKFPAEKQLNAVIELGAVNADITVDALKAACAAKDLSRAGITAGLRGLTAFNDGIVGPENLSDPGKATDTRTYILQPKSGVVGGLTMLQDASASDLVAPYLAAKG